MGPGVVAFAFAMPKEVPSNRWIAGISAKVAREINAPVFTQYDVPMQESVDTTYLPQTDKNIPPPTLRIARGAVEWALERKIDTFHVVCAGPHEWRCVRDLHEAAREAQARIKLRVVSEISQIGYSKWFRQESLQPHTNNRWVWLLRDTTLKLTPFVLYKKIAS